MGWKDSVNVYTCLKYLFHKSLSTSLNNAHFVMIGTHCVIHSTMYKAIQLQIYARVVRKDASHCRASFRAALFLKYSCDKSVHFQKSCDKLPYHCCFAQWTHLHMHVIRRSLLWSTQVVDRDLFNKYFGQVWTFTESIQPKNYRSGSFKNNKL